MLRIGHECGEPWPSMDDLLEILRKGSRSSCSVYGTNYAIRFTHKQMLPTPVLLAAFPGEPAQVELREHNRFALRSSVTSSPTLATQWHAGCNPKGTTSGIAETNPGPGNARWIVVEAQLSSPIDPPESPMKDPSMAKPSLHVGDTIVNLCQRKNSVWIPFYPHIGGVTFIE